MEIGRWGMLNQYCCCVPQGGDFIQLTRKMTGAKVAVDKPIGRAEDRLVHVEGPDE
jgi:hypothetical protein